MEPILVLSDGARATAGTLLLSLIAVEWGGWAMLRIVRGQHPTTEFQRSFARAPSRAGHAHAGMLVILALLCQILTDATRLDGAAAFIARNGVAVAAILFPLGFFLSSAGRGRTAPNRLIGLLYAGVLALTAGLLTLGIGLISV
jgi:hypothetical protein